MEVIELDGKKYVKAARAASESGYTTDYVGQLCRGGKIDSRLVGRTWYVSDGALGSHKRDKVRSNKKKTIESFSEKLAALEAENESRQNEAKSKADMPAYRKRLLESKITYESDDSETIPYIRAARLDIEESTARTPKEVRSEKVSVKVDKGQQGEVAFEATPLKKTELQGSIEVTEVGNEDDDAEGKPTALSILKAHRNKLDDTPKSVSRSSTRAKLSENSIEIQEVENVTVTTKNSTSSHFRLRSIKSSIIDIVPGAVAAISIILFLSGVFLQSVWTYDATTDERVNTKLEMAAVYAIIESLQ